MRILYGVVGEGMGHATRSKVILEHLVRRHEVQVAVSGRAHAFLSRSFPGLQVHEITGLTMVYEDNRVRKRKTARAMLGKLRAAPANLKLMARIAEGFRPDLAISDFDSFTYLLAKSRRIPVLSIDNMQVIDRCRHEIEIPKHARASYRLARRLVAAKLPRCDHYLITSFFFPAVRKPRTTLVPPILRREILEARAAARPGGHVLVYQTADSFRALLPALAALPGRFVVYGLNRAERRGNVELKEFSEEGFVRDLASARAVIAGGGFSLLGEAVYLGKPVYSVPIEGQFEQVLNALYLEALGYGEYHRGLDPGSIAAFLAGLERRAAKLAGFRQDGNAEVLAALDGLVHRLGGTSGAARQRPGSGPGRIGPRSPAAERPPERI